MTKDNKVIVEEIEEFVATNGGTYPDYYIGITNNFSRRIVESEELCEHLKGGWYTDGNPIYSEECISRDHALEIEVYFQKLEMLKYNPRAKGSDDSNWIYCFKLDDHNKKMILLKEGFQHDTEMITTIKKFKEFKGC